MIWYMTVAVKVRDQIGLADRQVRASTREEAIFQCFNLLQEQGFEPLYCVGVK